MPSKTPEKTPSPDEGPTTTEALAADVADESLEYPEGTPSLIPMIALPRMRKADAYEALGQITKWQREVRTTEGDDEDEPELDDEGNETPREIDPASYGAQYRVVAFVEQYLRTVAANQKAFEAWVAPGGVSDADLVKTFNIYLKKAQPGEAESSAG